MSSPRFIKGLQPTLGPVISPIESDGSGGLIVANNGCLPPVSLLSGEVMSLASVDYQMVRLMQQESRYVQKMAGNIRLPFAQGEFRKARNQRTGLVLVGMALAALSGWYWQLPPYFFLSVLSFGAPAAGLCWHSASTVNCQVRSDGRLHIKGMRAGIADKMLAWQAEHPEHYRSLVIEP